MKFLKKILSSLASALVVLLISGFVGLEPVEYRSAYAQTALATCQDMTMVAGKQYTDPVASPDVAGREAGVADSGQLSFDLPSDDVSYQACTADTNPDWEPPQPIPPTVVNGWAWNTNLGYISFACDASGSNPPGRSLYNCGSIQYGVKTVSGNLLRGFAWGDNIGWISMGCQAGQNNDGENSVACGDVNYGVKVAAADNPSDAGSCTGVKKGDLYGYAWTDSVGWMNFCGAHADNVGGYRMGVKFTGIDDTGTETGGGTVGAGADTPSEKVYANDVQYHELRVKIFNNFAPVLDAGGNFTVEAEWNDKVRVDQVTPCDVEDTACVSAVNKGNFAWDSTRGLFAAKITSIAPTNDVNKLLLKKIKIRQTSTSQTWMTEYAGDGKEFKFLPTAEVTKIFAEDEAGNLIEVEGGALSAVANTAQKVRFSLFKNAPLGTNLDLTVQLYNCTGGAYGFILNTTGDGPARNADGTAVSQQFLSPDFQPFQLANIPGACTGTPTLASVLPIMDIRVDDETINTDAFVYTYSVGSSQSIETTKAVGLQTIISYDMPLNKTVRYLSKNLRDGTVINQAAEVRGNVNIDVLSTKDLPVSGTTQSIGEKAASRREGFVRALRLVVNPKTTGRLSNSGAGNVKKIDSDDLNLPNGNTGSAGLFYYSKKNLNPGAGGKPCAVVLDGDEDIDFRGSKTIVAEGCNVFIDQNIIAKTRGGRLGIVALEDLMTGKGGNIYICSRVTDVEANFVADGSVFSYGFNASNCNGTHANKNDFINDDGTPDFTKKDASVGMRGLLKNQLTIKGSLQTNNTYGGSVLAQPLMCDGSKADTVEKKIAARYCDLNFLRYAHVRGATPAEVTEYSRQARERGENKILTTCWDDSATAAIKLSTLLGGACPQNHPNYFDASYDKYNITDGTGIVNVIYRAPAADMPIFSQVK